MGTNISVAFYANVVDTAKVFTRLVDRLTIRGEVLRAKIVHLRSSTDIAISEFEQVFKANLYNLVDSPDAIMLQISYTHRSGIEAGIGLYCYGQHYEKKWPVQTEGPIRLVIPLNELVTPEDVQAEISPLAVIPELGEQQLTDAAALFLDLSGIFDPKESGIEHGAMYIETGWPPSEKCPIIYHRDVHEFARDVARSYATYHWGILPPALFDYEGDILALDQATITQLRTIDPPKNEEAERPLYSWEIRYPDEAERRRYAASLDPDLIRRIEALSTDQLRELIHTACDQLHDLQCYDFGERGMVVMSDIRTSLWCSFHSTIGHSSLWRLYDHLVAALRA